MQALANRYANVLSSAGVAPEQRVIIALNDGPDFVAALFGILKIGAVVVMVNPDLKPDAIPYFFEYSRAVAALVADDRAEAFQAAADQAAHAPAFSSWSEAAGSRLEASPATWRNYPTHRTTRRSGSSPAGLPDGPRPRCSRIART